MSEIISFALSSRLSAPGTSTTSIQPSLLIAGLTQRQASGAMTGNSRPSASQDEKKNNLPKYFDIDTQDPEMEKAAVAIQLQFRKFQKKKQDVMS